MRVWARPSHTMPTPGPVACISGRSSTGAARPRLPACPILPEFAAGLVKGYGGALSSEHGDGRSRSWLNETFYGPELYSLFRQVKHLFDPHNLLNPGIIVDAGPMTDSLRVLPDAPDRARLDFSDYEKAEADGFRIVKNDNTNHSLTQNTRSEDIPLTASWSFSPDGFTQAIEMCNGAGVCRQRISGTMCPSFMVTREEMHSTRGRANALRAAMSGILPPEELTGERMYGVMDLCIGCKACKAECPLAVDMARLKTEFLARYYEAHGTPFRARFFGSQRDTQSTGERPACSTLERGASFADRPSIVFPLSRSCFTTEAPATGASDVWEVVAGHAGEQGRSRREQGSKEEVSAADRSVYQL